MHRRKVHKDKKIKEYIAAFRRIAMINNDIEIGYN